MVRGAVTASVLAMLARRTSLVESELLGLRHVVRPGDVCIDVGAAIGCYTAALSRIVGEHGVVHSVEPLPLAYPVLSAVLRLREAPNVRRHKVALGQACRAVMSVPFHHGRPVTERAFLKSGASGRGANVEFDYDMEVVVPTTTLDAFCADEGIDRLSFVKADVEGAELMLLSSGARTIVRHRPALLLEVEERHARRYGHSADDVLAWLREQGYRMHRWAAGAWEPISRLCPERNTYLFAAAERCAEGG